MALARRRPCIDCRRRPSLPGTARCRACTREQTRVKNARRRELAPPDGAAALLRAVVRAAGGWECAHCHRWHPAANVEVDHIVELEDGGTDADDNVQVLCKPDHYAKSAHSRKVRRGR